MGYTQKRVFRRVFLTGRGNHRAKSLFPSYKQLPPPKSQRRQSRVQGGVAKQAAGQGQQRPPPVLRPWAPAARAGRSAAPARTQLLPRRPRGPDRPSARSPPHSLRPDASACSLAHMAHSICPMVRTLLRSGRVQLRSPQQVFTDRPTPCSGSAPSGCALRPPLRLRGWDNLPVGFPLAGMCPAYLGLAGHLWQLPAPPSS